MKIAITLNLIFKRGLCKIKTCFTFLENYYKFLYNILNIFKKAIHTALLVFYYSYNNN